MGIIYLTPPTAEKSQKHMTVRVRRNPQNPAELILSHLGDEPIQYDQEGNELPKLPERGWFRSRGCRFRTDEGELLTALKSMRGKLIAK